MSGAFLTGLGIGLLVALTVGPIFLLCARTSARFGFGPGAGIAAGAAVVDLAYCSLGALGAGALLRSAGVHAAMGVVGGAVLAYLGLRALRDARTGLEPTDALAPLRPGRAFTTALVATASNPLTILVWAAVFSGAAAGDIAGSPARAAAFVLGTASGSLGVHLALAAGMSQLGMRLSPTGLRIIDVVSGVGLIVFGIALATRALAA